jgi:hypothetical protein
MTNCLVLTQVLKTGPDLTQLPFFSLDVCRDSLGREE